MTAANAAPAKAEPISVTADTTKGIIHGTAEINASPERVFRALTTPEMADWWGQGAYRTTDYKIDLRPGGSWSAGSRVTLLHTGFTGREQMAQNHAQGWTLVLGWLADYVAAK